MTISHVDGELGTHNVYDEKAAKRHLRGWLSYAFASEVFVVVSVTMFLPICLEQFARDNGVLLPDKTIPCIGASSSPASGNPETLRCVVKLGWAWVDTASFSLYVYSTSVALQALTVISMGGIANHPRQRKLALLFFAALGSTAAMLFLPLPSTSPIWPLCALFAIVANVGFGASVVAMNAYLPMLAREDKEVVAALEDLRVAQASHTDSHEYDPSRERDSADDELHNGEEATEPLLLTATPVPSPQSVSLQDKHSAILSSATARISGTGIALGYFAGIVALVLALIPVTLLKGSTFALRLAVAASGAWWAIFTIPAWLWLPTSDDGSSSKPTPPSVPASTSPTQSIHLSKEIAHAWLELLTMLRPSESSKLLHTFIFLGAWFLLSDGFATITATALLFAKTTLHMDARELVGVGLLVNAMGVIGALVWPHIQRKLGWTNKKVLLALVLLCSVVPAYGVLGFLPFFRAQQPEPAGSTDGDVTVDVVVAPHFGGLTTPEEMYVLAAYFGCVYGAFQAYARALYSELIPPREAARWFALYAITDKSSSFLGPLAVGLVSDLTGNIRYAFFLLLFMVWAAVPVLASVDVARGRADALVYSSLGERGEGRGEEEEEREGLVGAREEGM